MPSFLALPAVKLMTLHFQLLPPLFFCLWPMRAPLWQTGLREKVLPVPEKHYFLQFSSNGFPKSPPPWLQKYPVYTFKRLFRPPGQRQTIESHATSCQDCTSQVLDFEISRWTSDNRFYPIFYFCGKMLSLHKENT